MELSGQKSHVWNPYLVQSAVDACCGLHNWLEKRGLGWEEGNDNMLLPAFGNHNGDGEAYGAGHVKRDLLKRWIGENL
jgi:hypothetical protein